MVPYSKQPYREKSRKIAPPPSSQAYTNLDTSSGGLTSYLSRTLHKDLKKNELIKPLNIDYRLSNQDFNQKLILVHRD